MADDAALPSEEDQLPESLQGRPLAGYTLVEVFGGQEDQGGGLFSRLWALAGGETDMRDRRLPDQESFGTGDDVHPESGGLVRGYWARLLRQERSVLAKHLAVFQIPSASFLQYSETSRTPAEPGGDTSRDDVKAANLPIDQIAATVMLLIVNASVTIIMAMR